MFCSKRTSRAVRIPTAVCPSTTGTPEMLCCFMIASASRSDCEGPTVIGSRMMPLSARLTRATSSACTSGGRFLWMTPNPPSRAIAIAERASVTESIAALMSGILRLISRVSRVRTSTSAGTTSLKPGTSMTSSNVKHSRRVDSNMAHFTRNHSTINRRHLGLTSRPLTGRRRGPGAGLRSAVFARSTRVESARALP